MLLAAELPLPEHVFVHGFLLGADGRKMSKSLGNVLDPFEIMDRFGTEALRFYLMRDVTFGADGATSMEAAQARYEGELANELGNLASRTIAMINRYRDGAVPDVDPDPTLAAEFEGLVEQVSAHIDRAELTQALDAIWRRVRRLNRYVEEQAPWQLAKDDARAGDLDRVLRTLAEGLRSVTVLLWPWLPESTAKLLDALGTPDLSLRAAALDGGRVEHVRALEPLFPKTS
jgi:methionyl-tRNA synthetase